MRVVFMGSPEFARPILQVLLAGARVVGVVTQPDRPAGRGRALRTPPVRQLAEAHGLPVIQPARLRTPEALDRLRAWQPEAIIVAAYGQILPPAALEIPPLGCLNVHASLLPRWRGAAPVAAALLHGDPTTGVTLMQMDAGLDTGPILAQRAAPILPDDTAGRLAARLAGLGADLLSDCLPAIAARTLRATPQDDRLATLAPPLRKQDGALDWRLPAAQLERRVRAFDPWPGAYAQWQGAPLRVLEARCGPPPGGRPGTVFEHDGFPAVACAEGSLLLTRVRPAGRRPMTGQDFARGARGLLGSILPSPAEAAPP